MPSIPCLSPNCTQAGHNKSTSNWFYTKNDRKKEEEANLFKRHGATDVRVAMVNNATDMSGSLVFICIQFGKNLIILLKALFHDQAHSCQENMYLNVDQRQEYRWKVAYSLQSKGVGRKTSQNPTWDILACKLTYKLQLVSGLQEKYKLVLVSMTMW